MADRSATAGEELKVLKSPNLILGTLLLGVVLSLLNSSMVNVALNSIMEDLNIDVDKITWIITIYLLTYTVIMPIYGKLGDMFGHRKVYLFGLSLFVTGSILCSISRSFPLLLFSRFIQASGAASINPMSLAIITHVFPADRRGQAMGFWGAAIGAGSALGPSLGGFLIDLGGWNTIFIANVPIGLIALISAYMTLPKVKPQRVFERIDILGAGLMILSITSLLLGLTYGESIGWTSLTVLFLFSVSLIAVIFFIYRETRISTPLVDLTLMLNRTFSSTVLVSFIQMSTMISSSILMPLYLQRVSGFTPSITGMIILFQPFITMLSAPFAGKLVDKFGSRLPVIIGILAIIFSMFFLSMIGGDTSYVYIITFTGLFGLGNGFCSSPLAAAIVGSVKSDRVGSASGLFNMLRFLGSVFGSTLTGIILKSRADLFSAAAHPHPEAAAIRQLYLLLALINLIALFSSRFIGIEKRREKPERDSLL
ncbi:Multidrug resistance protein Stp [Koleobacter methoxysyntrophicus]|uniref:Multidrug resistance protein Stp n=1 Tax=Koleobacter methoxysyntrophicus TaxID=2751313 RepID=A0A8A0RND8_9FIRM|nr:DHA2 family efflux MFS transporter permease subunit [Koleobacter methoxysyntrophicus]QSQ09402.1 Multidrug resistance protein Stp [Koleobacter methoxysyntrophicus]